MMVPADREDVKISSTARSLADTINQNLIQPREKKFADIDNRARSTEEKIYRQLAEMENRLEEFRLAQKRMGILCVALSAAVIITIVLQLL